MIIELHFFCMKAHNILYFLELGPHNYRMCITYYSLP